jgi:superfamily II DNA or RNA helicase
VKIGIANSFLRSSRLETCELRDALDTITILHSGVGSPTGWRQRIGRIFREENLGLRLDEKGGVRYAVDQEFERNRTSAVAGLARQRYAAALDHFERAHEALDRTPPDTRTAVRQSFDAVETLFRLMLPTAFRLGASEVEKGLKPVVLGMYGGAARNFASLMLNSFADWVNAAHQYRHAEGVEQPAPPPLKLAVVSVSSSAAFLRWLAEVDSRL